MKALKEYINESKVDFDFYAFCDAVEDYAYNNNFWNTATSAYIVSIKEIFNKNTIQCNGAGVNNMNRIISKYEIVDVDYIYVNHTNGRMMGVHGRKFGYMYLKNINELISCFGEPNLIKIYKFVNKK